MPAKYVLEIYNPGSSTEAPWVLESAQPFAAVQAGDLMNPDGRIGADHILRVVKVEHLLFGASDSLTHKVCVFTANAKNDHETRMA